MGSASKTEYLILLAHALKYLNMISKLSQSHLVLNKFSDCLNFWILFFKSGAVANREETPYQKPYRTWGAFSSPARLQTVKKHPIKNPTGPGVLFQVRRGCKL